MRRLLFVFATLALSVLAFKRDQPCLGRSCRLTADDCCPCYMCLQNGADPACAVAVVNGTSRGPCPNPVQCQSYVKGWDAQKPYQCMKYSNPVSYCVDSSCVGPAYDAQACQKHSGSQILSQCHPACVNPSACVMGTLTSSSQNASQVCLSGQQAADSQLCGPIECQGLIAGLGPDQKSCLAFRESPASGVCSLNALGQSICSTDTSLCPQYATTRPILQCESAECVREGACQKFANSSDLTLQNLCYLKESSLKCSGPSCSEFLKGWDGAVCKRYSDERSSKRCNDKGGCEGQTAPEGCGKHDKNDQGLPLFQCGSDACKLACNKDTRISEVQFNTVCRVNDYTAQCGQIPCANFFAGITNNVCLRFGSNSDGFCDANATCSLDIKNCASASTVSVQECKDARCMHRNRCQIFDPVPDGFVPASICKVQDASHDCPSLDCERVLAGWSQDGAACLRFQPVERQGFCDSSGICADFPAGTSTKDSELRNSMCSKLPGRKIIAEIRCGSSLCRRADTCVAGSLTNSNLTISDVCFTDFQRHNCPESQVCDSGGKCVDASSSSTMDPAVKGIIVGVGIILGILVIVGVVVGCRRWTKHRRIQALRLGGYDDNESRPLLERHGKQQTFADLFAHSAIKVIAPDDIEIQNPIGTGASGIVYAGRWKSRNIPVAIKAIALISQPPPGVSLDEIQSLLAPTISEFVLEIKIMASLAHPNLMPLLGVIAPSASECRLITEYMSKGSLSSLLPHLERRLLFDIAKSIAMGMHYLVSRSTPILHRDLKLENVLVASDWTVKISDFGLSKVASPTMTQQAVGTPHYMAPECIEHGLFSEKSDVFAYGILVWELYTQRRCYEGINPMQIMYKVVHGGLVPPTSPTWPPQIVSLIVDCTEYEPSDRPTFKQIIDRMKEWADDIMLNKPLVIPTVSTSSSTAASPAARGGGYARAARASPGDMGGSPM